MIAAKNCYDLKYFRCFKANESLSTLVLDYTNIGDEGLASLCQGLCSTKSITKVGCMFLLMISA